MEERFFDLLQDVLVALLLTLMADKVIRIIASIISAGAPPGGGEGSGPDPKGEPIRSYRDKAGNKIEIRK